LARFLGCGWIQKRSERDRTAKRSRALAAAPGCRDHHAAAATVDVELPDVETCQTLVGQVKQGKVSGAAIDDAVRRLLRDKSELTSW
jgi:hypothetical protein